MVLGVKTQRMGGNPGSKSPLAGEVKQLAALSWVGGKAKGNTQGRGGTFPRTPGDFLTMLSGSLPSMLLSSQPP